ncbi:hypothetical protein L218DRAFT_1001735 [Marasmius fiardii PR-910]|nr:hypothetical protein L218DRAFT_1001735 [Marasmius fiardii PR-910]
MPEGYAPSLGAGLALLNLFGLSTTAARVCAVIIIAFLAACLLLRYRYPCLSPSSLSHAIEEARTLFDKCNTTGAFIEGEEASFGLSSAVRSPSRITVRALEVASRAQTDDLTYVGKVLFLWNRLKDTADCYRRTRSLIRDLQMCLARASYSGTENELQLTAPSTLSNLESSHPSLAYDRSDVDDLV